jgi:hypothetical protein
LLYVGRTRALSKKVSLSYIVVTICSDVHSNGATILRGLAACFALCAFPP